MHIVFVTPEYITEPNSDGGLATYIHRISLALLLFGHKPLVIVASTVDEKLVHKDITVYRVDVGKNSFIINYMKDNRYLSPYVLPVLWILQSWRLNKCLRKINNTEQVDIVQYASYMASGIFRLKSVPSIVRISSMQSLWEIAYGNVKKNITIRLLELIELRAMRRADLLIGPGKIVSEHVSIATKKDVILIKTPFLKNIIEWDESVYNLLLKNKKYILFFGTIGLLKGVGVIADVIEEILSEYPDLYYVFAGKDTNYLGSTMLSYLKNMAGSYKDRVIYLGSLRHELLFPVIKKSEIVTLPSRIDNFPNSCIESMSLGKIVIGTKGASFEQIINNEINGFLCEIDNPSSFLSCVKKALLLSQEEKEKMENFAKAIEFQLRPSIVVDELLGIYRNLIYRRATTG